MNMPLTSYYNIVVDITFSRWQWVANPFWKFWFYWWDWDEIELRRRLNVVAGISIGTYVLTNYYLFYNSGFRKLQLKIDFSDLQMRVQGPRISRVNDSQNPRVIYLVVWSLCSNVDIDHSLLGTRKEMLLMALDVWSVLSDFIFYKTIKWHAL